MVLGSQTMSHSTGHSVVPKNLTGTSHLCNGRRQKALRRREREKGERERNDKSISGAKIVPHSQYKLGDEGTFRNELTNENTLEENRILRREAPQGVGEGDVTETDEAGRDKSCLTLLEPLTTRVRHSCDTRRAVLRVACGVSLWKKGKKERKEGKKGKKGKRRKRAEKGRKGRKKKGKKGKEEKKRMRKREKERKNK